MAHWTPEIVFRRSSINICHDLKCFDEEGADLNDALLDFLARLGQALVPSEGLDLVRPPVAFLGSLFFGVLCKGGVPDGRSGHANVANWARRRLGPGGLFQEDVGGLAVAVNETLRDERGEDTGKHWWLALLLNLGPPEVDGEAGATNAMVCLDSYARCETAFEPPCRSLRVGAAASGAYPVEVVNLARAGCHVLLRFRARGDGSAGQLPPAFDSVLRLAEGRFVEPEIELSDGSETPGGGDDGDDGGGGAAGAGAATGMQKHGGYMHFELHSNSPCSGEHVLEYAGEGEYEPPLKLMVKRRMSVFQRHVASFLRGYLQKEWLLCAGAAAVGARPAAPAAATPLLPRPAAPAAAAPLLPRPSSEASLPDVPQQETSNDCGFFLLEQFFLVLQLAPASLRSLAQASAEEIAALPWPTQAEIDLRKAKLHDLLSILFNSAKSGRAGDVEAMLREDPELLQRARECLVDESSRRFVVAVEEWELLRSCSRPPPAGADAKRRCFGLGPAAAG